MRIIKAHNLNVVSQNMEMQCEFILHIRLGDAQRIQQLIEDLRVVNLEVE